MRAVLNILYRNRGKSIHPTNIHDRPLSWLGTGTKE